jgi:hypothetical protein
MQHRVEQTEEITQLLPPADPSIMKAIEDGTSQAKAAAKAQIEFASQQTFPL